MKPFEIFFYVCWFQAVNLIPILRWNNWHITHCKIHVHLGEGFRSTSSATGNNCGSWFVFKIRTSTEEKTIHKRRKRTGGRSIITADPNMNPSVSFCFFLKISLKYHQIHRFRFLDIDSIRYILGQCFQSKKFQNQLLLFLIASEFLVKHGVYSHFYVGIHLLIILSCY
mgnify:CR=1 FL=1